MWNHQDGIKSSWFILLGTSWPPNLHNLFRTEKRTAFHITSIILSLGFSSYHFSTFFWSAKCCRYHNVDRFFLFFSPLLFLIFNMIYWTYFQVLLNPIHSELGTHIFQRTDASLISYMERECDQWSCNVCFRFGTSGADHSSWKMPQKARISWQGSFYSNQYICAIYSNSEAGSNIWNTVYIFQ